MKSDRELLELAAKAAGIEVHESDDGTIQRRPIWAVYHCVQGQRYGEVQWNPLRDDAQALRLAVKRGMYINIEGMEVGYRCGAILCVERIVLTDEGLEAATRRAIVRAAAAIGEKSNA